MWRKKTSSINFSVLMACAMAVLLLAGCGKKKLIEPPTGTVIKPPTPVYGPATIDLSNWKVTLPIPNSSGSPIEVSPPAILGYATNATLLPFMYNDSTDESLVFYTYPYSSTANSSYSRTELREQMVPGSNTTNWTFPQGGKMRGTLSVPEISKDKDGDFHRTIIMQIHGRLTDAQKNLIGAPDNNAPPMLKIYWRDGRVYVRTKELKDTNATYAELLETDAWEDDNGRYFTRVVGHNSFILEVEASNGKLVVTLDDAETFVYENIHMQKWGVFENYFKAGNYLNTTDAGAFAYVKYFKLEVSHD